MYFNEIEKTNIITEPINELIKLDAKSYLSLFVTNCGFTISLHVNNKVTTLFHGKTLIIHHTKAICEKRDAFYRLNINDCYNGEAHEPIYTDKKTYEIILKFLAKNELVYTYVCDCDFEEYVYIIQKTECSY